MISTPRFRIALPVVAFAVAVTLTWASGPDRDLSPFTSRSFDAIRAGSRGRPLVITFWSTACEPCQRELAILTRLHPSYPNVRIVAVAADAPALRATVQRFLARYRLGRIETWQFDDEPDEKLRYSVDPAWRGELPRAYFISADGTMSTHSGVPDEHWVEDWLAHASAKP